jgi:hypothetical protein
LGSGGGRSEVGFAVKKEYNEIMEMEESGRKKILV